MKRFILIDSMRLDALKSDYINYPLYYDTFDEAKNAAAALNKCWIMKSVDYMQHIFMNTKAVVLWSSMK